MDNNQKLVSQIADLSRNLNLVNESLKRNTQGIQTLIENQEEQVSGDVKVPGLESISKELKDISNTLTKISSSDSPFYKIAEAMEKTGGKTFDFTPKEEIKGQFQKGGVAKEDGKYLVGENGPEVVQLPKGSGVIPINAKDLIDGLKKVPELSDLLKNSDTVNVTGSISERERAILSTDNKRIYLAGLIDKYEEEFLMPEEGKPEDPMVKASLDTLEKLSSEVSKAVQAEFAKISQERIKLNEGISLGEGVEVAKEREKVMDEIRKTMSPEDVSDLGFAKASLQAEKIALAKRAEVPESKEGKSETESKTSEKPEAVAVKTDLKKMNSEVKSEEANAESGKGEKSKASGILSKLGKSAERVAEGVAQRTGLGGVFSVAKRGIGALSEKMKSEESPKNAGMASTSGAPKMEKSVSTLAAPAPKPEPSPAPPTPAPTPAPTPSAAPAEMKTESAVPTSKSEKEASTTTKGTESKNVTSDDLKSIKGSLARIAFLLEGPLTVSNLEDPFRPNSRRV